MVPVAMPPAMLVLVVAAMMAAVVVIVIIIVTMLVHHPPVTAVAMIIVICNSDAQTRAQQAADHGTVIVVHLVTDDGTEGAANQRAFDFIASVGGGHEAQ